MTRSGSGFTAIAAVDRLGDATRGAAGSGSLMSVTLGPFRERRVAPRPCRDSAAGPGYASGPAPRHRDSDPRLLEVHDGRMPVHVERVVLPGIGVRHDILTADGRRLSVVSFRDGGRELALSDEDDPDRADETITLTDDEATALSEVLGGTLLLTQLAGLRGQIAGLHMEQIPVRADSPYVGRTLGDTKAR